MVLVYLDQNALIRIGVKASNVEFRARLDAAIQSGKLIIVVSSWHLIETANTAKVENAVKLAEFMDSLRPGWLLEREKPDASE